MKKRKNYIVTIISKKGKQEVEVIADNKIDAENIVDNVLLGCEFFVFNNKSDYKLKIRQKRERDK